MRILEVRHISCTSSLEDSFNIRADGVDIQTSPEPDKYPILVIYQEDGEMSDQTIYGEVFDKTDPVFKAVVSAICPWCLTNFSTTIEGRYRSLTASESARKEQDERVKRTLEDMGIN